MSILIGKTLQYCSYAIGKSSSIITWTYIIDFFTSKKTKLSMILYYFNLMKYLPTWERTLTKLKKQTQNKLYSVA